MQISTHFAPPHTHTLTCSHACAYCSHSVRTADVVVDRPTDLSTGHERQYLCAAVWQRRAKLLFFSAAAAAAARRSSFWILWRVHMRHLRCGVAVRSQRLRTRSPMRQRISEQKQQQLFYPTRSRRRRRASNAHIIL